MDQMADQNSASTSTGEHVDVTRSGETLTTGSGEESRLVMSERVQTLAGSIYQELERMISQYDEGVVKTLMPLVVNVLENLDLAYTENQEHEVELELLREDNEQLVTQYEREKQLRRLSEQRALELEDNTDEQQKVLASKIESLESIVRMFELKRKNMADQVSRLEEKEETMKKEYGRLHERYNELLRSHMEHLERSKFMLAAASDRHEHSLSAAAAALKMTATSTSAAVSGDAKTPLNNRSSGLLSLGFQSLELAQSAQSILAATSGSTVGAGGLIDPATGEHPTSKDSLQHEIEMAGSRSGGEHPEHQRETSSSPSSRAENMLKNNKQARVWGREMSMEDVTPDHEDTPLDTLMAGTDTASVDPRNTTTTSEHRSANNLYQELSFNEPECAHEQDDTADTTGDWTQTDSEEAETLDKPGLRRAASDVRVGDNFFGVGKEVDNLIKENNELLATKNALNIVKDDLIAQVDELTGENEILREEVRSIQTMRSRLQLRIGELEEEAKRLRDDVEKAKKEGNDEEEVPMAQRKRFTRVEMARVLMERNQFKERYYELQEAMRWTEMIRASRQDQSQMENKNKQGIWKFFSNLFSSGDSARCERELPYGDVQFDAPSGRVTPVVDSSSARAALASSPTPHHNRRRVIDFLDTDISSEKVQQRLANERREQYKKVRAHVEKDDGRMQAYGWSLPAKASGGSGDGCSSSTSRTTAAVTQDSSHSAHVPVPVPVYCRPLMEKESGMKIWCAAGVDMSGGFTCDGGSVVGASVFYSADSALPSSSSTTSSHTLTMSGSTAPHDAASAAPATDSPHTSSAGGGGGVLDAVETLNQQLTSERVAGDEHSDGVSGGSRLASECGGDACPLVWICSSTHNVSHATVVDANNPADVLDSFPVCSSHLLCIASVPGADVCDYDVEEQMNGLPTVDGAALSSQAADQRTSGSGAGSAIEDIRLLACSTAESQGPSPALSTSSGDESDIQPVLRRETTRASCAPAEITSLLSTDAVGGGSGGGSGSQLRVMTSSSVDALVRDGVGDSVTGGAGDACPAVSESVRSGGPVSSLMPTMWLGSQSGCVYVHSARAVWRRCIHSIKLADSVLAIVHVRGRVLVSLANGTVAVFHRRRCDGQWDLGNYHLLDLRQPQHGIRCMLVVRGGKVWCGCRNRVHVIDPVSLRVEASFAAHPRRESQVRQMATAGDGVWMSIRLDSTLRLYHAHTRQHLQDVDVEPYVSRMLGLVPGAGSCAVGSSKLGYSFVRISSLMVSCGRLWIGTGNGVVISVPLNVHKESTAAPPGGETSCVVYADEASGRVIPASFVPLCHMPLSQLSFHGHRDAVKFFVAVRGGGGGGVEGGARSLLVMSGGEGYIDFRLGDMEDGTVDSVSEADSMSQSLSRGERSHLIVWQLTLPTH